MKNIDKWLSHGLLFLLEQIKVPASLDFIVDIFDNQCMEKTWLQLPENERKRLIELKLNAWVKRGCVLSAKSYNKVRRLIPIYRFLRFPQKIKVAT